MTMQLTDLIRIEDFASLKHKLVVYNLTSYTEVLRPELFRLSYFTPTHFSIQAPQKLAFLGHTLEVYIFPDSLECRQLTREKLLAASDVLCLKVKVEALHDIGLEGFCDFVLKLEGNASNDYLKLIDLYRSHQDNLDQVMKKCK